MHVLFFFFSFFNFHSFFCFVLFFAVKGMRQQTILNRLNQSFLLQCSINNVEVAMELDEDPKMRDRTLSRLFDKIDDDGSGELDADEFFSFIQLVNSDCSRENSDMMFKLIDSDGSGSLELNEFRDWIEAIITLFFGAFKRPSVSAAEAKGKTEPVPAKTGFFKKR